MCRGVIIKRNSSRVDFIYLNEQEMIQAGVKDMNKCIDSMEDMFILLHRGEKGIGTKLNVWDTPAL